jgi:hypothetical protein
VRKITVLCMALALFGCSEDHKEKPAEDQSAASVPTMTYKTESLGPNLNQDAENKDATDSSPRAAQAVNTASSGQVERPAAKYADKKEWESIQRFCSAMWKVSSRTGNAHDKLMRRIRSAMKDFNLDAMAYALRDYQKTLDAEGDAIDAIEPPDVSDKNTANFMVESIDHLRAQNIIESEKNNKLLASITNGEPVSDEETQQQNREGNGHMALFVLYMNRIYWNYGYQTADIEDATFRIKKTARPSATTNFSMN